MSVKRDQCPKRKSCWEKRMSRDSSIFSPKRERTYNKRANLLISHSHVSAPRPQEKHITYIHPYSWPESPGKSDYANNTKTTVSNWPFLPLLPKRQGTFSVFNIFFVNFEPKIWESNFYDFSLLWTPRLEKESRKPSKLANPIKLDSLLRNMYTGLCTFAKNPSGMQWFGNRTQ